MTWLSNLNIKQYNEKYTLKNFVETGCYQGKGIAQAFVSGYENVYSCDIGLNFVEMCRKQYPIAQIEHTESMEFLKNLLPKLKGKTLFWLDAHFPELYGTNNNDDELRIPLIAEIELIKKYKKGYKNDVILCDDMRTFRSKDNPRYRPGEIDDKFYIDVDWIEFENILSTTHNSHLINDYDGVMLFTPK